MVKKLICLDTSVLIDYFRKKDKGKSFFFELTPNYHFAISAITKLEILHGSNDEQRAFWDKVFYRFQLLPFGNPEVEEAVWMIKKLRARNKMIALPDILIGATAKTNNLELATLNAKHFARIADLQLILPK